MPAILATTRRAEFRRSPCVATLICFALSVPGILIHTYRPDGGASTLLDFDPLTTICLMAERIEQLRRMLESEPDDSFCLYALAQELAKQGDRESALTHFDRALEVDPTFAYASFHKARVLEEMGRSEAAIKSLEDGLIRARDANDAHAMDEIAAFLDELRPTPRQ